MSLFGDLSTSLEGFTGRVRVFPLPNLVLFPHVMQPLHIFEPRYRALLEDALANDGLIAMALLTPGWEKDYEGRPDWYPMACLGRITTHFRLPDGTYNVLLLGLQRVRLVREISAHHPFREAEVELCEDQYELCSPTYPKALQKKLCDVLANVLPSFPEAEEQLDQLLGEDVSLGVLTDVLSYMLDIAPCKKQRLLNEVNVHRRSELLLADLLEAAGQWVAHLSHADFPPEFSVN
jgi:Lon protease-like protein